MRALGAACWIQTGAVGTPGLGCQLLGPVGSSTSSHCNGSGVCPQKQLLGGTGVNEGLSTGSGLWVTAPVPGGVLLEAPPALGPTVQPQLWPCQCPACMYLGYTVSLFWSIWPFWVAQPPPSTAQRVVFSVFSFLIL